MSTPQTADQALPPVDPKIGLMFSVADLLIPLFKTGSIDVKLARRMAVSAIEAYQPETRADYVNIARTIAFSMSALALLGKAAAADLTPAETMRTFSRATALNRSADQSERSMMQRRRYLNANPPPEQPPAATPESTTEDALIHAAITDAMKDYLANKPSTATKTASTPTPSPKTALQHPPETSRQAPDPLPRPAMPKHGLPDTNRLHPSALPPSAAPNAAGAQSTSAASFAR
jgi:hypothetical protein